MAKRILSDYYTFDPTTKTITIPNRVIHREQLLLVVNVTSNTVLYNFSDPDLTLTSYTAPYSSTGTQFTLAYNTVGMNSADPIMIMEDVAEDRMALSELTMDATNKLRVTNPQSLIDTDFEYGLQGIKWESLALVQNWPSYYLRSGANSLVYNTLTGGNQSPRSLMAVATPIAHGLVTGDVVSVQYSNSATANGVFLVVSSTALSFGYVANGVVNGVVSNSGTAITGGAFYDQTNVANRIAYTALASDNVATTGPFSGSVITVTTAGKHGLAPGTPIFCNSSTTTNINGNFRILDVPAGNQFRYVTIGTQTGVTSPNTAAQFLVRPEVNFIHRASDGGVMITTGNIQEGVTAVRQTRRYFRYQSGKGLAMSTGTKFTPSFDTQFISSTGTFCQVTTQQTLGFSSGVTINVEGTEVNLGATNPYNGTFTVTGTTAATNTFTYNMSGTSTDTAPGGAPIITVKNWKGAVNRVGLFDFQNGFYYEYDGQTLFAVRRNSVRELPGTVTATSGATTVLGAGTSWHKQLIAGDYVVIRGQSYQVTSVDSSTTIQIAPAYRGNTVSGVRMNKTESIKIPQSEWNLDRCDGSGPSGYNLDITKMQMAYIDYTWYGAGFVRFGWRMTNGDVLYCHKIANNNSNNQAYMRSGNLPARYEVSNIGPYTKLVSGSTTTPGQNLGSADVTMVVADAKYWPSSGTILVQQGNIAEVMNYGDKEPNSSILTAWNLTGLARRQFGANTSNLTFIPTEFEGGAVGTSAQCAVTLVTCECAPTIMHWGTSVIMDGGYDDDRSIQFAYARLTSLTTIAANTSIAVLSLRLAPSVDNSIASRFGDREVINRMQLQMRSMGLVCNTSIQILGILNPSGFIGAQAPVFPTSWSITSIVTQIGSGSLAQVIDHTGNAVVATGGEQIFGFVTSAGADNYDISQVRDLGASIISGDGSIKTPGFPNAPDMLTIILRNANAGPAVVTNLRLSWTEAQA
jgi:hypothetical protein